MMVRLRRFDGAYRRFLMRVSLLTDAAGQVVKRCGVGTDTEGTLSAPERENHFRAILDGLPVLVTPVTPAHELVFANRQTLDYFGATLHEAKRGTRTSTFHPDDRPEVVATWVRSVERGAPYNFEGRQRRADGKYRRLIAADVAADPRWAASPRSGLMTELDLRSCWFAPILSGDGTVLGILAIYRRGVETPTVREVRHLVGVVRSDRTT